MVKGKRAGAGRHKGTRKNAVCCGAQEDCIGAAGKYEGREESGLASYRIAACHP